MPPVGRAHAWTASTVAILPRLGVLRQLPRARRTRALRSCAQRAVRVAALGDTAARGPWVAPAPSRGRSPRRIPGHCVPPGAAPRHPSGARTRRGARDGYAWKNDPCAHISPESFADNRPPRGFVHRVRRASTPAAIKALPIGLALLDAAACSARGRLRRPPPAAGPWRPLPCRRLRSQALPAAGPCHPASPALLPPLDVAAHLSGRRPVQMRMAPLPPARRLPAPLVRAPRRRSPPAPRPRPPAALSSAAQIDRPRPRPCPADAWGRPRRR